MRWLVALLIPATAFAQGAPDEPPPAAPIPGTPPPQPPPPVVVNGPPGTPQPLAPGPDARALVMTRPWSVSLSLGPASVKASDDKAQRIEMTALSLAGHYRVKPELDLGLDLLLAGGGGASNDSFALGGLLLDARFRFLPGQPWNAYAMGSLGVMSAADKNADSNTKKARGALRIGAGIERRWTQLAVGADVFAFAITKNDSLPDDGTQGALLARSTVIGFAFTLGGAIYF